MQNEQITGVVRFGPFALDTGSGELTKSGNKVPLQDQPFQILRLLTERPGQIVTREEIRSRLWPDDTVVEFENAVNAAIKKLRIALGDSAEDPHYVETLRRRGYRLMVEVERAERQQPSSIILPTAPTTPSAPGSGNGARGPASRLWTIAISVAAALLAIAGFGVLYRQQNVHSAARLSEKDNIVLADFNNKTNDPVFSDTLRQGLTVQLEQSPFLNLVSEERIHEVLQLMGQPANAVLAPTIAMEVCERTGSTAVVEGEIANLGSQYVLWVRGRNCRTGQVIDEEQMTAAKKEDVLSTLSQIATRFRRRVGEAHPTVDQLDTPLADATTPSLDALKAYSLGFKVLTASGAEAALPLYQRAIQIDPQFAMAYAMLGRIYGDMAESGLSAQSTTRAWQLRSRASNRERFFIDASYDMQVTGDMDKARQTCEAWEQMYPRDPLVRGFLSGTVYPALGRYPQELQEAQKMLELAPDLPVSYNLVALGYLYLGKFEEAAQTLQLASDRKMQMPDLALDRYQLAFLSSDQAGIAAAIAQAANTTGAEDLIANQEAFEKAYSGHLRESRTHSRAAVQLATQAQQQERAALFQSGAAVREAFYGNAAEAKQYATASLALSRGKEAEFGAGFAQGLSGDAGAALRAADDLERRFPDDTSARTYYVPSLRALAALDRNDPAKALEWLQRSTAYGFGIPQSCFFGNFGALYPIYLRGEAYLALHQGAQAAAEFQAIVDHRNIVISDPVGALAQLQLARAYAMTGDNTKARGAYTTVLALWANADRDLPLIRQARLESLRLQ